MPKMVGLLSLHENRVYDTKSLLTMHSEYKQPKCLSENK